MPHWKKSFPSRFLQVSDVDGGPITATIRRVVNENVGGDEGETKLVLYFQESAIKPLVLNLTRAEAVAEIAGENTDDWPGVRIAIVKGTTRYQGRKVGCLTVAAPSSSTPAPALDSDSADF